MIINVIHIAVGWWPLTPPLKKSHSEHDARSFLNSCWFNVYSQNKCSTVQWRFLLVRGIRFPSSLGFYHVRDLPFHLLLHLCLVVMWILSSCLCLGGSIPASYSVWCRVSLRIVSFLLQQWIEDWAFYMPSIFFCSQGNCQREAGINCGVHRFIWATVFWKFIKCIV